MTDREAFIAAILAKPDDDSPRLIYADWLDEQGECERAAWIRTQIGVERGDVDASVEEELWNVGTIGGGFLEVPGYYGRVHWVRGFIESLTCSMSDAARHLDAIVKEHPIKKVEFTDRPAMSALVGIAEHNGYVLFFGREWPGIEFVLPPRPHRAPPPLPPTDVERTIRDRLSERMAEVMDAAYAEEESAIMHGDGTTPTPRGTIYYPASSDLPRPVSPR